MNLFLWHGCPVNLLTKAPFLPHVKRNALIEFATGYRTVVPWRSLRRPK